jgi:hypothetical protein
MVTSWLIVAYHHKEQRLGPTLVFDGASRTVHFPRDQKKLQQGNIAFICIVSGYVDGEWGSQLQARSSDGGRFLLAPAYTRKELELMMRAMAAEVQIPFKIFTQDKKAENGWREENFGRAN